MRDLPKSSGNFDLLLELPEKYSVELPKLPCVVDTISCYNAVRECNRQSYEMFRLNDGTTEGFPSDFCTDHILWRIFMESSEQNFERRRKL